MVHLFYQSDEKLKMWNGYWYLEGEVLCDHVIYLIFYSQYPKPWLVVCRQSALRRKLALVFLKFVSSVLIVFMITGRFMVTINSTFSAKLRHFFRDFIPINFRVIIFSDLKTSFTPCLVCNFYTKMIAVIFHLHHEAELEWKVVKQEYEKFSEGQTCPEISKSPKKHLERRNDAIPSPYFHRKHVVEK